MLVPLVVGTVPVKPKRAASRLFKQAPAAAHVGGIASRVLLGQFVGEQRYIVAGDSHEHKGRRVRSDHVPITGVPVIKHRLPHSS